MSVNADAAGGDPASRLDLGPTWFWPTLQPELSQLLDDLGLPRFAQHDNGHALLEHPGQPPQRIRGYAQAEPSLRLLGGPAALFGSIGVPAQARSEHLKDWAQDPFTATAADREEPPHHAPAPPSTAASGPWQQRSVGVGSEWSPQFPGYVAGAVDAARRGVQALLGSVRQTVGPGEGA